LEFDGFEEVSLLGLKRVFEELLDVGTHSGCGAKVLAFATSAKECDAHSQEYIPTVIFDMITVFQ